MTITEQLDHELKIYARVVKLEPDDAEPIRFERVVEPGDPFVVVLYLPEGGDFEFIQVGDYLRFPNGLEFALGSSLYDGPNRFRSVLLVDNLRRRAQVYQRVNNDAR